ncbi:hypothetical protein NE237_027616 [Protea cynaroides]|uniref:Neprosin PEP catalytic domain-containing protein n=1 Tax=Protea cynaroides TaxID=273540 RepID=A0A9Q0GS80_9MAGN|nr:hypothetical protein NE237_027616 [Protea cynaroides]
MALAVGNGNPMALGLQSILTLWLAFLALFVLSSREVEVEVGRNEMIPKDENLGMIRQFSILNGSSVTTSQDSVTGNWWLMVTNRKIYMGYWPKALFSDLGVGASSVVLGVVAKASADGFSSPMGSGYFPNDDYNHSSFFMNMKCLGPSYSEINPRKLKQFVDNKMCYDISYDGEKNKVWGYCFRYGGPGGKCG